jgi:hypothetical protein
MNAVRTRRDPEVASGIVHACSQTCHTHTHKAHKPQVPRNPHTVFPLQYLLAGDLGRVKLLRQLGTASGVVHVRQQNTESVRQGALLLQVVRARGVESSDADNQFHILFLIALVNITVRTDSRKNT